MFYFRCWQHFSCVKKTMLCSMVLAKVWFFFGCKVLMVSGRKLAFAGSEGDHWMLPSSTIINYATFHHYCEDIPSGSHLIQGTGAACKLRPSQKPTSPTLLHPLHPLARFSVCLFFPPQPRSTVRWLSAGVVGLRPPVPTDWEEDGGGGGTQRLRTPGLPHTCHPPAH